MENRQNNWQQVSERITWYKKPTIIKNVSFNKPVSIKWYEDGELNVSVNCIDRHLKDKAQQMMGKMGVDFGKLFGR